MKASELRIGNNILDENGKVITLFSIHRDYSYIDKSKFDDLINYEIENGEIQSCILLNDCNPIIITEEILLKAGFKETDFGEKLYNSEEDIYWTTFQKDYLTIKTDGNKFYLLEGVEINGFHHIQNLVYDLTDKELKIKL